MSMSGPISVAQAPCGVAVKTVLETLVRFATLLYTRGSISPPRAPCKHRSSQNKHVDPSPTEVDVAPLKSAKDSS